jgi:16S rRNA (cytosine967-C5)-methyltransferase
MGAPGHSIRFHALRLLFEGGKGETFLQERLHECLETLRPPERDRRFLTETVLGVERNRMLLDAMIREVSGPGRVKPFLRMFLRLACYQALFLDRVPGYAIKASTLECARAFKVHDAPKRFLGAVVQGLLEHSDRLRPGGEWFRSLPLFVRTSHPAWLVERWRKELGDAVLEACLSAGNTRPPVWLYPVPGGAGTEELEALLRKNRAAHERLGDGEGIRIARFEPFVLSLLTEGRAVVQSPHQRAAVRLCPAKPGERVLEGGAAPGGKTVFLAARAGGKGGGVVAADRSRERLQLLEDRVRTLGLENVNPVLWDLLESPPADMPETFSHVVLDPPCSNLAELSRRPEARYRATPETVAALAGVQRRMAENAWKFLEPGGTLLYITCTLVNEENRGVRDFLVETLNACLIEEIETVPTPSEPAGGYACLVRK